MFFCDYCGKDIPGDAQFCRHCGKVLQRITTSEISPSYQAPVTPEIVSAKECELKKDAMDELEHKSLESGYPVFTDCKNNTPQPWLRFWARHIDILFFTSIFQIMSSMINFNWSFLEIYGAVIFSFILLETILLIIIGTTPGKWLANIRITNFSDKHISVSQSVGRTSTLWVKGMWLGVPLLQFVPMFFARRYLLKEGTTKWDMLSGTVVRHNSVGMFRFIGLILATIIGFVLVGVTRNQ